MSDDNHTRQLRNERNRRYRLRQHPHRREVVVEVPICEELSKHLVAIGYLGTDELRNRKELAVAIVAALWESK